MNAQYSRLESRLDTLDSQLGQLDSRVDTLDGKLAQPESGVDTLDSKLSQLDSRVDELTVRMDENSENPLLEELSSRLDSQQSQLDNVIILLEDVDTGLATQRSQLAVLTNTSSSERSRLVNTTERHRTQIDELKLRLAQVELAKDEAQPLTAQMEEENGEAQPELIPRDCSELPTGSTSGIHQVQLHSDPSRPPIPAVCDMDTDGGNWTVFQRRGVSGPRRNFFLGWDAYKEGFGNQSGEFWWGLENLWLMTSGGDRQYELRIELVDFSGVRRHAVYQGFSITSEDEGYKLTVSSYTGDAGDGLRAGVNRGFSTRDRDQDSWSGGSCAERRKGGWWYGGCGGSSLNGRYRDRGGFDQTGIWWYPWRRYISLKSAEMKIRRV